MADMPRQDDLTNEEEVLNSVLPSKRSADKASPDCVKKQKALDKEAHCNAVHEQVLFTLLILETLHLLPQSYYL